MEKQRLGQECKRYMAVEIKEKLKEKQNLFISHFSKISVTDQEDLRRQLHKINASFFVVKNRIAQKALKDLELSSLEPFLEGMTAIATGNEEAIEITKTLVAFAGKNENFEVSGGYFENQVLDMDAVKKLAAIPSRETLLAQVFSGFQSPIQGFVNTLSATIKGFVVVLNKINEKKQ